MKAEIVSTGTELLLGETLNTSAHYLTGKLSSLGIEVDYHTTVGDNPGRLEQVLYQAIERSDLIVTTGGLGPTLDDLTKELVAKVLDLEMEIDVSSLEQVKQFFGRRKAPMPSSNEKQAYFPKGSQILPNPIGTAPGAIIRKDRKIVVILPGPPFEMQPMFDNYVWPELERIIEPTFERMNERVLKVFGIGESAIEKVLDDLMNQSDFTIALLAKRAEMHIRLVARSVQTASGEANERLNQVEEEIRRRLGNKVFGRDQETMIGIVGQALSDRNLTISSAESCTGGLLGAALTQEPGSSKIYLGGVVSYSNSLKQDLLGVQEETLKAYGAVSEEVAKEMAEGIRSKTGSDLSISTTGIAGPDGGSNEKPVGLVYIGFATSKGVHAEKFQFYGERDSVRQLTVQAALNRIRLYLKQ
ncbi:competence/damage-inducible protein CinA-like protein [Desulfosporosinus orientis DSM 765]|uniref:Putative competence-damage inducible protein n=1 Tax=Desulfosporosinus orientis (strain ATCC 19365 / DSM 765 / NCIMB 8382 / VKM B-1628 / Singapore I) TaxID=768706 RepID=G7WGV9_DESOD|nr:competence/damage-inducible protein A [Desulfosporosinus orientis]AET68973.1 competence/damage-inducible protein CinA-like protein [Desulfosporosinus orientis DSM 765]